MNSGNLAAKENEMDNHEMKNKDDRIFPVFFMFISLVNLIFCLGFIFFIDLKIAFVIAFFCYLFIVTLELKHNIRSPVSIFMLLMYTVLTILSWFDIYIGHRAGIIIFTSLALLVGGLLLVGKPFTAFYSAGRGLRVLHYTNSAIWLQAYLLSLFFSIWFVPEIEFILVPYAICVMAGLVTIFFSIVWFGNNNIRKDKFSINNFDFKRITESTAKYQRFFIEKVLSDEQRSYLLLNELQHEIANSVFDGNDNVLIFCAYDGDKMVGCIRCVLANEVPLPIENEANLDLQNLKRIGSILQVGRFSIDEKYRERPEIITGLFKCLIELALAKDISFIIGNAATHRVTLYMKLGFHLLFPPSDPRSRVKLPYGTLCTPVIMNFSNLIIKNRDEVSKYGFIDYVNRYLLERWYKRAALRYYLKKTSRRPWELEVKDIRKLLNPVGDIAK
ncbi:hypothetical protein IW01_14680 [Pectobacterium brasiliense]|uniref:N-acyl amino acid synthase FeeM domain-containing protein n=1 Tax=Pectobacterium brasiliense TaxID=180957 RepID=UPI0004E6EB74|nr:hypothetical protein [Pectobacterium brasiliense]KFF67591.1 hypothetical protein IW01_14680 [Pectobacterium brasiliense]